MFNLKDIKSMNDDSFEKIKMSQVFGGLETGGSSTTLATTTVTPTGNHTDTGDEWDGEDEGALPPCDGFY